MGESSMLGGRYAAEVEAPEIYRERRRRLAQAVGGGTVVAWGAGDERGYGDVGTFHQDPSFFYLTGVELPNAVLVLRPAEDMEILFLPPRNQPLERWTGPKWAPGSDAADALGFDQVLSTGASEVVLDGRRRPVAGFEGRLAGWLGEPGAVLWTTYPALSSGAELGPTHRLVARLRERLPSFEVRDLTPHLTELRLRKAPGEVALMRRAIAATVAAQRRAARVIAPGVRESTVDGVVYATFREHGAEGLAFPSIVGSGLAGTVLHYDQNTGVCRDGDLVVVDIGARYGYYCGDLTRTYPVRGRFTERQRELYDLVLAAHQAVAAAIRPGVTIQDLRKVAYEVLEGAPQRDARGERLGQHFIHGIGHFLGLEAHDPGAESRALEPGMVITNEPGLYLAEETIGIRIEDDFLVTADGAENLSEELERSAESVEGLMRRSVSDAG